MRGLALAAVIGVGMTLGGVAAAREWTSPNGRITFDAPSGWVMEVRASDPQTVVIAGNANNECYVLAVPNAGTANATPGAARRMATPTPEQWTSVANAMRPMFPSQNATVTGQSSDSTGFWPIQRAEFSGAERPVMGALQGRPGVDLMAFCWTYGGPDATATYESFFRSLGTPNDAALQAAAAAEPVPQAQAAAAPEQQPAEEQPQRRQRRGRGLTVEPSNAAASPM